MRIGVSKVSDTKFGLSVATSDGDRYFVNDKSLFESVRNAEGFQADVEFYNNKSGNKIITSIAVAEDQRVQRRSNSGFDVKTSQHQTCLNVAGQLVCKLIEAQLVQTIDEVPGITGAIANDLYREVFEADTFRDSEDGSNN